MHYLDNASTTRPCAQAIEAGLFAMGEGFGNPSSLHSIGMLAEKRLEEARAAVAAPLGCRAEEIYFTSGGTEADNWALFSGAELMRRKGRHIITTAVEHDAVLNSCKRLEAGGCEVTYLKPGPDGRVTAEQVLEALREDTVLVSVMLVNNESGAKMPIAEIAGALKKARSQALLHTDAVQGYLKLPFTAKSLGADMISLSAHKIHGAKGAGALYVKSGLKLPPFIYGGGQESKMRSGTQGTPMIFAFGAAAEAGYADFESKIAEVRKLRDMAEELIRRRIPEAVIISGKDSPHILSLAIPGCPSQPVLNLLAGEEVYVSAGSACSRGKRSHVLVAMGLRPEVMDSAVRASFSRMNTAEDVEALVLALEKARDRFLRRK